MKELPIMVDPIRSFPIVTVLFIMLMAKYKILGRKGSLGFQFYLFLQLLLVSFRFKLLVNHYSLDNIPISILIIALSFFTWLTFLKQL